jgi:hypothetical protein
MPKTKIEFKPIDKTDTDGNVTETYEPMTFKYIESARAQRHRVVDSPCHGASPPVRSGEALAPGGLGGASSAPTRLRPGFPRVANDSTLCGQQSRRNVRIDRLRRASSCALAGDLSIREFCDATMTGTR